MKLEVHPLSPDLWPALEDFFGPRGACNGCWCMYWRIGPAHRRQPPEANRVAFRQIVDHGPPPGLLAFYVELAVGWCQVTPRAALPWLDRSWAIIGNGALPVWSLSCFYVRKGYRRQGVTSALIQAAVRAAKAAGARLWKPIPLDGDRSPSASSTGYLTTFVRAGFEIAGHRTPPRPILRPNLKRPVASCQKTRGHADVDVR